MRKKYILYSLLFFSLSLFCTKQSTNNEPVELLERLQALSGVEVTEIVPQEGFERAFEINFTQPVDHHNPGGQKFTQRAYLSHVDESMPMVFAPSGYGTSERSIQELTVHLKTNQLAVVHRYFPNATPQPLNWQYLTIEQAAADHHRIVDLINNIYKGKWVSTGDSKGGMTCLFHKRFYPSDVDAVVAKVAPIMFGTEDPRFDVFLEETVGDEASRQRLKDFQRLLLENRNDLIPMMRTYFQEKNYTPKLDEDSIFELVVLEYPFAFWQMGLCDISDVPVRGATAEELYNRMSDLVRYFWFDIDPFYYQAYTELGYYGFITNHISDLLIINPTYNVCAPDREYITFKPEVMLDINNWLQTEGNNIIYIYGVDDPYTAASVELTGQTNALKIVQPGKNHRVKIYELDQSQLVMTTLEQWLGIDIEGW